MGKRIRVTVTQEDIDKGLPHSITHCPIARALGRLGFPEAVVVCDWWYPDETEDTGPLALTRSAKDFVSRFDDGRPVKPQTFLLPAPDA